MATGDMFVIVEPTPRVAPTGPTLLRNVNRPVETDGRWELGLKYRPDACGKNGIAMVSGYCGGSGDTFLGTDTAFPLAAEVDYQPGYVEVAQKCSAIGGQPAIDLQQDRAKRLLKLSEGAGIAMDLWRGDIAAANSLPNDYLGKTTTLTQLFSGATTKLLRAFSELEHALAECSVAGGNLLHVAPRVVGYLAYLHLVDLQPDGTLRTKLGTRVVADQGYDGSGPGQATADATANTTWMYGTGPVDVRIGEPQLLAASNQVRPINDFVVYASEAFAATFDPCCHVGVKADLVTLS